MKAPRTWKTVLETFDSFFFFGAHKNRRQTREPPFALWRYTPRIYTSEGEIRRVVLSRLLPSLLLIVVAESLVVSHDLVDPLGWIFFFCFSSSSSSPGGYHHSLHPNIRNKDLSDGPQLFRCSVGVGDREFEVETENRNSCRKG